MGCGRLNGRVGERDAGIVDKLNCPPFLGRYSNTGGWHGIGRVGERDAGIADKLNCPSFLSRYSNLGGWYGIGRTLSELSPRWPLVARKLEQSSCFQRLDGALFFCPPFYCLDDITGC